MYIPCDSYILPLQEELLCHGLQGKSLFIHMVKVLTTGTINDFVSGKLRYYAIFPTSCTTLNFVLTSLIEELDFHFNVHLPHI